MKKAEQTEQTERDLHFIAIHIQLDSYGPYEGEQNSDLLFSSIFSLLLPKEQVTIFWGARSEANVLKFAQAKARCCCFQISL